MVDIRLLGVLLVGLVCVLATIESTDTKCIASERRALLNFKKGLIDDANLLATWTSKDDNQECCGWRGVSCNEQTGHVVTLDLRPQQVDTGSIRGQLGSSLLALSYLSHLDLSQNKFTIIPDFFGSLRNLTYLDISANGIEGMIPHQLGNLSELKYLDLSRNNMTGNIPYQFGNLCSLRELDLSLNKLSGFLSDFLQNLTSGCTKNSLEILRLDSNQLRGVFPDITTFSSLREIHLNDNKLDGIFSKCFRNFSSLLVLNLDRNELQGSTTCFSSFTSLRELSVSENKLNGSLSISDLSTSLTILDLSVNFLHLEAKSDWVPSFQLQTLKLRNCELGPKFPNWLQTQKNLTYLDISNAKISDVIPTWFWTFSSALQYRNISFNNISGEVPDLPFKFDNIPSTDLSNNRFHGLVPMFLFSGSVLNLSKNKFRGSLSFLCTRMDITLTLTFMDLSHNMLSGELPDCWMHLNLLRFLNLENNNFFGKIPVSVGSLLMLETLRLRNNRLSGDLPLSLQKCRVLKLLDLGENTLSGEVSTWIGDESTNLIVLRLRSNNFRGSISSNICKLISLQVLDLSFNNISGSIPSCLNNFTAMVETKALDSTIFSSYTSVVVVGYAQTPVSQGETFFDSLLLWWKGAQQEYGKILGLMKVIDLSSNRLEGKIPEEVTSLHGLISLNLSRNKLDEIIPTKIGTLKMLQSLDLSRNQLSGEIPPSLADSTFLGVLDLSNNKLSGRIPSSTQLQSFNASSYIGNLGLCGLPLPRCPGDDPTTTTSFNNDNIQEDGGWFDKPWFFAGTGFGFFTGFCVVFGTILFNDKFRRAYFRILYDIQEWLLLMIALKTAGLKRRFIN